jgi:hypothetical protein
MPHRSEKPSCAAPWPEAEARYQARLTKLRTLPRDRDAEAARARPSFSGAAFVPALTYGLPAGGTNRDGTMNFSLMDADGAIRRYRLPVEEIRTMARCMGEAIEVFDHHSSHSDKSSGKPISDESSPSGSEGP